MLKRIRSISNRINWQFAVYIAGGCLFVVTGLIVVDATSRTIFDKAFMGMHDVLKIFLAWVASVGLAYALITGRHVRVTLFVLRMPPLARSGCELFTDIVGTSFFTFLTILTWPFFWESMLIREVPMGPVPTPVWMAKLALAIGSTLIMTEFWLRLIQRFHKQKISTVPTKGE